MLEQPIPNQEPALYVLNQKKSRIMVPKVLSLLVLGGIFYVGVLLNVSLLQLKAADESTVNIATLVLLLAIVFLGIYLGYAQVSHPYVFYQNRIQISKKQATLYQSITEITRTQNILDKMFKCYSLNLGNKMVLKNIPLEMPIENYLQQLKNYSQTGYNRY